MLQKYKKSSKGLLLLEEIIKIFVAFIILGSLIWLAVWLSRGFMGNLEENQARATLDNIANLLSKLKEGDKESYVLLAPSGWHIVFFYNNTNYNEGFEKPSSYFGQHLLCVCKKKCKICRVVDKPILINNKPLNIVIGIKELWFENEKNYYSLTEKPTIKPAKLTEEQKNKLSIIDYKMDEEGVNQIICEVASNKFSEVESYFSTEKDFAALIKAIVIQESNGKYNAVSECGAVGLMQLMPSIASNAGLKVYGIKDGDSCRYKPEKGKLCDETYGECMKNFVVGKNKEDLIKFDERFDEEKNIKVGVDHLISYIKQFKDVNKGILAYYAGPGGVQKCKFNGEISCEGYESLAVKPNEYVAQVLAKKEFMKSKEVC